MVTFSESKEVLKGYKLREWDVYLAHNEQPVAKIHKTYPHGSDGPRYHVEVVSAWSFYGCRSFSLCDGEYTLSSGKEINIKSRYKTLSAVKSLARAVFADRETMSEVLINQFSDLIREATDKKWSVKSSQGAVS